MVSSIVAKFVLAGNRIARIVAQRLLKLLVQIYVYNVQ